MYVRNPDGRNRTRGERFQSRLREKEIEPRRRAGEKLGKINVTNQSG